MAESKHMKIDTQANAPTLRACAGICNLIIKNVPKIRKFEVT